MISIEATGVPALVTGISIGKCVMEGWVIVGATGNRNTSYRSSIVAQSLSLEYINYISPLLLYTYTIYISLDILQ
jgi:hypothetical protein